MKTFSIAAQPLGSALTELARQAGVQLLVKPSLVAGKAAPAVEGHMTTAQALAKLLAGSDLVPELQADTLTVKPAAPAPAAERTDDMLPVVTVAASNERMQLPTEKTRSYTIDSTTAGSKIALSPKETPQSVSVLSRAEMDDFHLNGVNDALQHVTGVTVDQYETDRTDFNSRGFQITNFQFDGVGLPLIYQSQYGDIEMALYDRVEVLRGADGLNAQTGNPSATVNLIRKRPTYQFQASGNVSYGSWNTKRVEADISGPLNAAGTVAGRLVAVHQDGHSYIDRYKPSKDVLYGVIEASVTPDTLVTLGYSYQRNRSPGAQWGGLPLLDADGRQMSYGVGTSLAPSWAYFNTEEQRAFAELSQQLGAGWKWKTSAVYNDITSTANIFYPLGSLNADGTSGFSSYTSWWKESNRQLVLDTNVSGKFDLFGRSHDLVVGANFSRSELSNPSREGDTDYSDVSYAQLLAGTFPKPVFNGDILYTHYLDVRRSLYASSRWNLSDRVKLLLGINYTQAGSSGDASGTSYAQQSSGSAPYVGLTVDLTPQVTAYTSFTKIFNPQYQLDINSSLLGPARGQSLEAGIKGAFLDNRLNASLAVYRIRQTNIATDAGLNLATQQEYYTAGNATSKGIEAEVSGRLTPDWNVSAGATLLRIVGDDGLSARTFIPRKAAHLSTTYRVPALERKLTVGSSVRWQSATRFELAGEGTARQNAYASVDFMMRYDVDRHFSITGNLNNAFNNKHFATLEYDRALYAAPLNGSVTLTWRY
ncbi:TonB-dependent siderophore receptor [Chitinasiproducens palmae]|uniref:TonB-dependent siderophore receptor n=1 Tax=Chitinasiproducens palmae TaxID=1770053 RepID=UPI001480B84B|nr:TonB-dependent receptor [Chitinasiproducens palmae]